ncbi:MAG: DUF305 domain-containing protein [Paracoccaceae bacterium]
MAHRSSPGAPTMRLNQALTALAVFAAPALAQEAPSTEAYRQANAAMHGGMAIDYTGNPDVDFARGMIPHHEGAVAMAKIVLQYGTDPEIRKLAESIVAAQEGEISWMQGWLAKNGQ